uniref:major capsid protein n=1 Tax=Shewanella sp. TaxID=50422 RepID=UPI004048E8F5
MARMPTVMAHDFSKVPKADIPRSSFNRSHGYKTTMDAGYLVPIFVDEALPGDTFNLDMSGFGRLATPINPIMDNMYLDTFFFAVPVRLLWDNWQKFHGEQIDPGDSTDYTVPVVTTPDAGYAVGSLFDYFGVPTEVGGLEDINALHSRAYNLIYNE